MSKKDPDAAELFKKYSPEIMPDQSLAAEELTAIVELIKNSIRKKRDVHSGWSETFPSDQARRC